MVNRIIGVFLTIIFLTALVSCNKSEIVKKETKIKDKDKKKLMVKKPLRKVVLIIDNKKFYDDDFKEFLNLHGKSYKDIVKRDKILSYLFENYIVQRVIYYKLKEDGFKYDRKELVNTIKKKYNLKSYENLNELTKSEIVKNYLYSTLYSNIKISEKDARRYYLKNQKKYRKNAEVLLYEILLDDKNKAKKIRAVLNTKPEKFSEIAKKESKSKVAKEDGCLGYVDPESFPKSLGKFIKSAGINKVTPVVEFLYGEVNGKKVYTYHIFKVTKRKRKRLLFFSKVKESIIEELTLKEREKLYRNFTTNLFKNYNIKTITKNLFFKYKRK